MAPRSGTEISMNREPSIPETDQAGGIARLDDDQVRSYLSGMPAEEQSDLLLALDWRQRLRVIRNSGVPEELVQHLPDEEVLLTLRGAGEEDALDLIALTSPAQLQFILDVDLWAGDTLDAGKAVEWMRYLIACGENKVTQFFESADLELLVILLDKLIYLIPNEEGVRIPAGLANIMQDEFFTILSKVTEETDSTRLLLRIIRQWNRDRFYEVLFAVHGSVDSETEEKALRWRNSRLEKKGLLEFDEAIEIYGYLNEDESRRVARSVRASVPDEEGAESPTYPVRLFRGRGLFYDVLVSIDDLDTANRLRNEIAFAANRLLVADAGQIGEFESIRSALNRLFSLVNVGLLFLAGSDRQEATEIVKRVAVKDLFQIGFSRAAELRTGAVELARRWWPGWREYGFLFLDHPEEDIMKGLMERVPQYHPLAWGGDAGFRDFATMEEITRTRDAVEEIGVVADVCFGKLGIPEPQKAGLEAGGDPSSGMEHVTLSNLMATGFANLVLSGAFDITPIAREDTGNMFETMFEDSGTGEMKLREPVRARILSWLKTESGLDARDQDILAAFAAKALGRLEEEIKRVPSWQDVDPRYIGSILLGTRNKRGKTYG
jgi:hypothetical protein